MAQFTYTATASDGSVFTWKSDRTYTHAVVCTESYQVAQHNAMNSGWRRTDISNFKFYQELVAKWDAGEEPRSWDKSERTREIVAAHGTAEQYAETRRNERIALVEKRKAEGKYEEFFLVGFCGRRDLAMKSAAKCKQPDNRVEILELTVKAK